MLPVELIDIDSLSNQAFDIEESVELARELLEELNVSFEFEDDKWTFENHLSGGTINLDFTRAETLNGFVRSHSFPNLKTVVKCWIASLGNDYFPLTLHSYFHYLLLGLEKSHLLEPKQLEPFIRYLTKETDYHHKTVRQILLSLINFIDFYEDIDDEGEFLVTLINLKNGISHDTDVRELPSSKDILTFSSVISDYFLKSQEWSSVEYIKYAPIYIWWELTNIIPMRPSEFCLIERTSLSQEDGKNYIRVPRKKKPKAASKRNIQVIDTFHISSTLYAFINDYIRHTEPYGHSDTLISYRASASPLGIPKKRNVCRLTTINLNVILKNFYKFVVEGQYGYSVNRHLRPNDTRHLAFLNLLMQGIHPIEIARLGGHLSVRSQYHYFQHQEYWVDSEIEKLMLNFEMNREAENNESPSFIQNWGLNDKFKALYKPPTQEGVNHKLKIGFCTDSLQRCKTDSCLHCEHWRITPEELNVKQSEINAMLNQQLSGINDLYAFLRNLHSNILKEQKELHPILVKEYSDAVNKIKSEVYKFARFKHNIKVGE